jgi:hypothetical protein
VKVGLLGEQVVVVVVMEDAELVAVGERGDEQVDGWEAMMPDASELTLCVEGSLLDPGVDGKAWEGEQTR